MTRGLSSGRKPAYIPALVQFALMNTMLEANKIRLRKANGKVQGFLASGEVKRDEALYSAITGVIEPLERQFKRQQ